MFGLHLVLDDPFSDLYNPTIMVTLAFRREESFEMSSNCICSATSNLYIDFSGKESDFSGSFHF